MRRKREYNFSTPQKFSIIIAAKNEAENLPRLISALTALNYPADCYEIIIVDDNSTDNTFRIAEELIEAHKNFRVIKAADKIYPGKKGALDCGIKAALYNNIMITDADCTPQPNWLKYYSMLFTGGYDFVFAPSPFIKRRGVVNGISCFENLKASFLTFSFAAMGIPYSAAARNFGFSKEAFNKVDGYKNTTETLSGDDDLLLREAGKHKLKTGYILDKDSFVYSETVNTFADYYKQKTRHTKTSVHYLLKHKIMLAVWHLLNLLFLFSPVLYPAYPGIIYLFITKMLADIFLTLLYQKKFNYSFTPAEIIFYQLIYEVLLILFFISALIKKDSWK